MCGAEGGVLNLVLVVILGTLLRVILVVTPWRNESYKYIFFMNEQKPRQNQPDFF